MERYMNEMNLAEENVLAAIDHKNRDHQKNLVAYACVETAKALRYLKALCNHFDRKVTASYDDVNGCIQFPFGDCELHAAADALLITVSAESETMLARTKDVVADHLVRFGEKEELAVNWVDATP